MSHPMLTDADTIALESFYDAGWAQDRTDEMEIGRWSKYGNDRLYINSGIPKADKYSLHVDLQTHEIVSDNEGRHTAGSVAIDGDTATIVVEERGDKEHEIVVSLSGDAFETSADDNQQVVCDGGEGATAHVADETIEAAIEQHDDAEHPDATTIEEVRDALAWLQRSTEEMWGEWCDNIERGEAIVVAEDDETIVLSTGTQDVVRRDLRDYYDGDLDDRALSVISAVIHELARERADYDWGVEYPYVVRKPAGFDRGQEYADAVINSLRRRGVSPGQAWAYYGVEIRGHSRNQWAERCGYSDHSAVSEAVRKAQSKIV